MSLTRKATPPGWTRTSIEIDDDFDLRDVPVFIRRPSPNDIAALHDAIRTGDATRQRAIVDAAVVFVDDADAHRYGRTAVAPRLHALLRSLE
ncbi:MAG TPA: hypothetical protein VLV86_24665 [Vicinamibacterales bacterium]|nr:hypothetical protein [Vicinamibacterales bacterium]